MKSMKPFNVYPTSGNLSPGCTQLLDVTFSPHIPQYEVLSKFVLQTAKFSETDIIIHGIGASSKLVTDSSNLNFGILRVGTQKTFKLRLKNKGILQARYFIECSRSQFSVDLEQGLLDGDSSVELLVKFAPKTVGKFVTELIIQPQSAENYRLEPIIVQLSGTGSYPELVVLTKVIDFGTALYLNPNSRQIKVENRGTAEAHLIFTCHHPAIQLETGANGDIILPSNSKCDLNIVYTPQVIEHLDVKVFLRSSDTRGEYYMIQLKGSVGVPKMTFDPPNILEELNFGVCIVNGHHKKQFTIKNEGNITLNFETRLDLISATAEEHGVIKSIKPSRPVVFIEPSSGRLAVGDSITMTTSFIPEMLADYSYNLTLKYDFRNIQATIFGTGGRAILVLDSPLRILDFDVCRINRVFRKSITVSNMGNLGVHFHVRPDGFSPVLNDVMANEGLSLQKNDEVPEDPEWVRTLRADGLRIVNPDGFCKANSKTDLIVEYKPIQEASINSRLKVYFDGDSEDLEIRGKAAIPQLAIYNSRNELLTGHDAISTLDLGVHPVNSEYIHSLQMINEGPFGIDFLVQPIGIPEFDVSPSRGYIEPHAQAALKVFFRPNSENKFQMSMKVLWERDPLKINVIGSGGIGKLEVGYVDEKDASQKLIDFGMVPFNSASEKRFFLYNTGLVPISINAEIDNEDFTITQIGDPFINAKGAIKPLNKRTVWNWYNSLHTLVPPAMGIEVAARFLARSPAVSTGSIAVKSECRDFLIPMKGKGGTISISHKGDLNFGDIASNFTYIRKIVLTNTGSIPSNLSFEWLIVGHASDTSTSMIRLSEQYSALDPRSGWARTILLRERGIVDANFKFTAKDNWRLISKMIQKREHVENTDSTRKNTIKDSTPNNGNDSSSSIEGGSNSSSGILPVAGSSRSRLGSSGSSYGVHNKKNSQQLYSAAFKRKQMFFHLITTTQVSSQSQSTTRPYIKVDPGNCILPSFGEVSVNVEVNISTEETFLATLLVKSSIPNTPIHEIALTATPKAVSIVCDDTRILNFFRQPLGESEVLTRVFTNVGHKDIGFKVLNNNPGLVVVPSKGTLKVGQNVMVQFIFRPMDETMQNADVIFEPDCSQPIRLKMSGGGGLSKASLAKYRRFDFGHCMIGKDTVSLLPITNEGNAILHLTRFQLYETDTFFKGVNWPTGRVSLFPGQSYNLALVFNPHEESPAPGKLIIGTNSESWEIELIGLGREAVLIVSKVALEFTECLIGNSYERKLGLKNVGDVNYPVTFKLEREFPDLEFIPPSLVINPFSEGYVIVSYTPTKETKSTVVMTVSSPYSTHKVPVLLHAGTAILEFSSELLDFGMFEKVTRPSMKLVVKNTGTVRTSYNVRDVAKPSRFQLTSSKGLLHPGKSAEVTVTHIRHEVCQFNERLIVRSDLIDKFYYIKIKGQCEQALLKPEEFSLLNMGVCPVLESTTKILNFTNYGRFRLDYTIKSSYPLKVNPSYGVVGGDETAAVNVTWNPSGGYELRTQLTVVTNIGNYNVIIRGKAAFPELTVKNMYLGDDILISAMITFTNIIIRFRCLCNWSPLHRKVWYDKQRQSPIAFQYTSYKRAELYSFCHTGTFGC
jgi:hypothetical protein